MNTQAKLQLFSAFIRQKLNASIVTVTTFFTLLLLTVCLFWYAINHALSDHLSQQTEVLGNSLATQTAFNATQSILSNDLVSLNILLNRLVADDNILSARVYSKHDELLAEADSNKSHTQSEQDFRPNSKRSVYSSSIKFREDIVGHVLVTLDKTPAQNTLQHLNTLLISVSIFVLIATVLIVMFVTKQLFLPIQLASSILNSKKKEAPLSLPNSPFYKEARTLYQAIETYQERQEAPEDDDTIDNTQESSDSEGEAHRDQFEINFDAIFEESKQRSCVLYFKIVKLDEWHKEMTQLQVANLLTPIYRAIFQACESYSGQVHQYDNDSAIVLFSGVNSKDNLYMDAISAAQVLIGLINKLFENELYADVPPLHFHLGLHLGNSQITDMVKNNQFEPEKVPSLLEHVHQLSESQSHNVLVMSEEIFTLTYIQSRVFTGLPETIEREDNDELLAYEVKGTSDKYTTNIKQQIKRIAGSEQ